MTEGAPAILENPRRRELVAALVCLLAAIALTWPMAAHFFSRLGGDPGDPLQTLWSWRWMRDALFSLRNPFFTDRVFHPQGSTLVFETFDIPTAVLAAPLWSVLPPVAVYNAGVLFAFWLTAFGMYRLARELTGDFWAALAAGILFCAAPYHLAHVQGHQHLSSMGWLPLFLVHLTRMLRGQATRRDAILGGLFLALASLASWYHLLYALVATPVLFADAAIRTRKSFLSKAFAVRAVQLAATYLIVAGPLLVAILYTRAAEHVSGAHDPIRFSGDLQAFFFPNQVQGWAGWFGGKAFGWSGNATETALYMGYVLVLTAIIGAILAPAARAWLVAAALGAVLALGPYLHVGGRVDTSIPLPYLGLEAALPQLSFMGVPVRLGYVMYLGLCVAAAFGMAALRSRFARQPLRIAAIAVPMVLTLVEYIPRPFIEAELATPAPMAQWAKDPSKFAVLDLSGDFRMMWHATLHRHPILGGNLTRVPSRLEGDYWDLPVVQALRAPGIFRAPTVFERRDSRIDFNFGGGSPDPRLRPDEFAIAWRGELNVPRAGKWKLFLTSDDGSRLVLDGKEAIDNRGAHGAQERSAELELSAGAHPILVDFTELGGGAEVRFEWQGPGGKREIVPASALSAEGAPGLVGSYRQATDSCRLTPEEGRALLREIGVRYVVTGGGGNACAANEIRLRQSWAGAGIRVYEVEPAAP